MSKELALFESFELPAYLKLKEMDAVTKALMGSAGVGKRLSIKGGVFRMIVKGNEVAKNEDRAMQIVIVAAAEHVSREYYSKTYSEEEITAPDCWSLDGNTPAKEVKGKPASRCVDCPNNAKGSGQGDTRACRFLQHLGVVLGNDLGGDVYQLRLPAMSIFGAGEAGKWPLQAYAKAIASRGFPITALVTEMRFDTDSATPKMVFKPIRPLTEKEHALVIKQGLSEDALQAIRSNASTLDGVLPTNTHAAVEDEYDEEPKPVKKAKPIVVEDEDEEEPAPKPVKKAKPIVVEDEDDEELPEPVKTQGKAKKPVDVKADVAAILSAWDDED